MNRTADPATGGTGANTAGPILAIDRATKRYGNVVALDDVSLSVAEGEFVTLLGPSGSGKTTLLKIIAGAIHPTSGRLALRGRDITREPSRSRGIGLVFQNFALMPHLSVFENIAFPLRIRKVAKSEIRRRVTEALEAVRLPAIAERKPRELSGGQQQRVAIARCLVYRPPIILMDEPLGALDRKLREQMQYEIKQLHEALGLTMIYVTHDQEEALTMSDRICLMDGGRICEGGTPSDIYVAPKTAFAAEFFGAINVYSGRLGGAIGGSAVTVHTPDLGAIRAQPRNGIAAGDTGVRWMIRPERIRVLGAQESDDNVINAVVGDRILSGGLTRLIVYAGDTSLTVAQLTGASAWVAKGDRVRIGWPAAATVLLEAP